MMIRMMILRPYIGIGGIIPCSKNNSASAVVDNSTRDSGARRDNRCQSGSSKIQGNTDLVDRLNQVVREKSQGCLLRAFNTPGFRGSQIWQGEQDPYWHQPRWSAQWLRWCLMMLLMNLITVLIVWSALSGVCVQDRCRSDDGLYAVCYADNHGLSRCPWCS